MQTIVFFGLFAVAATQIEYFTTENDNLDWDAVHANPKELNSYLDCYLDKGPCTELALSYKKNIPEAVQDACRRCNDNQKLMVKQFLEGLKLVPEKYQDFKRHYDPENKYFDALEREVSKINKPIHKRRVIF